MTPTNGHSEAQGIALFAIVPADAQNVRFYCEAQWSTRGGLICPKRSVQVQPLNAEMVLKLYLSLVEQGSVHQVVRGEDGTEQHVPLPAMHYFLGPMPQAPEVAAPPPGDPVVPNPEPPKSSLIVEG